MHFAFIEIFGYTECEMKSPLAPARAFHTPKAYFTHEVHFTNPAGVYFVKKRLFFRIVFFLALPTGIEPITSP